MAGTLLPGHASETPKPQNPLAFLHVFVYTNSVVKFSLEVDRDLLYQLLHLVKASFTEIHFVLVGLIVKESLYPSKLGQRLHKAISLGRDGLI